ncbi:guanine deaminase [Litoreibacter roseus]|uniref:Guanine deaminase n=1 Tax=Litoreibacter roseus TaxID=2601869 RepID=A0A6N6JK21_9RHOB|nr:guanine deaminase [Litoreibacter roseus]GFE65628.1 guanine deaminase [Litoreibacter roseus]
MTGKTHVLRGQTLQYTGDPFAQPWDSCAQIERRGAVVIENGLIAAVGPAEDLSVPPGATVTDYGDDLIMAGFIDAHVHYPQTAMIASWGKRLIDWLNTYTFPEEARFNDSTYARKIAARYFDLALGHGTTTSVSYATSHPESVDAYFEEAKRRGLRAFTGKTCMDRNAPDSLRDTPERAYTDSKRLLETWHGVDRLGYVITPRFSPTSTPEQLDALGALWAEHPDCLMQTHLSEQSEEIAWVKDLYPDATDYLDTYEAHGLVGARGLYGHAIHLTPREKDRLQEVGAGLVHCPTSNTFIGSGVFDMAGLKQMGQRIGLATDTGGGSSFSMLRTMAAAYELGQLNGGALHPSQLLWLATCGSAQVLHADHQIGNLSKGLEADLVVLNLSSTAAIAQRIAEAEGFWDSVFPTIMMGDDRAIRDVWIAGNRCDQQDFDPSSKTQ